MSDQITPQLREEVLERLRATAASRTYTKSPEEIEQLILERARGVKKVYLDLLSRVLDPTSSTAGSAHMSHPQITNAQYGGVQRLQHPLPSGMSVSSSAGPQPVAPHRPRLANVPLQPNVHSSPGSQGVSVSQPISSSPLSNRNMLSNVSLAAQAGSVSVQGHQPVVLYQQPVSVYATSNDTKLPTNRPLVSHAQSVSSNSSQSIHPGNNYGVTTGQTPIMIRTTSSGSIAMPSGQPNPIVYPDDSSTAIASTTKPVFTVLPGASMKTTKSTSQTPQKLGTPQIQQSRVTMVSSTPSSVVTSAARTTSTGRPNITPAGSRSSASSSSKSAYEVQTPEVQAQIVSRLTDIANRYLPAVRHAIQLVSLQPESHAYVRKYTKLKDILENPEANLHVIRLSQVNLIEQLLQEIEKNPMHLVQQHQQQQHHQQQQQQQPQAQAKAVAAAVAAAQSAAAATANSVTPSATQSSDARRHPNVDQSRHHLPQQQQQQPPSQLLSRFRVPTTNLNTLLSQPLGGASPTGTPDAHQTIGKSPHGKPVTQTSSAPRTSLASTSPDAGVLMNTTAPAPTNANILGPSSTGLDSYATARQSQFPCSSLEGQLSRPAGTGASYVSPCGTSGRTVGPTTTHSHLQLLATELKKLADKASHDKDYARRFYRAINDISQDLRPFRESAGLLLPQDLYVTAVHNLQNKDPGNGSKDIDPCLPGYARSSEQRDSPILPTTEDITDLMETGSCELQEGVQSLDVCLESASQLDNAAYPRGSGTIVKMDDIEITSAREQNGLLSDKAASQFHHMPKRTKCTSLFIDTPLSYDPEAVPMTDFSSDQLERLNPIVRHEIDQLHYLHINVQANTDPPSIDDMETYSTCMDASEWNASCHLKLTLGKENAECLPCSLPPLLVRLAPDYVTSGHLNWYYSPKSDFQPTTLPSCGPTFTANECREFLDLFYRELDRKLQQQLRRVTHYRLNLKLVAKSWLDAICTALSQFVKLDLNAPLIA